MLIRGAAPGARLYFALAVLAPALLAALPTGGSLSPLGALTSAVAVAFVVAVVLVCLPPPAAPVRIRAVRLREYAWQAAFLRLRDPDAQGRPRPRAPTARGAAA